MPTFKTSAVLELIDNTAKGAKNAIRNFAKMEKAADGFNDEAKKGGKDAARSYEEFAFETKRAEDRLKDLRRQLRSGKGDFNQTQSEIRQTKNELEKLNKENRGFSVRRGAGRFFRGGARGFGILTAAATAAGAATFGVTNSFAAQADEAVKLADSVGFSVEAVTSLQFAVGELAGDNALNVLPAALRAFNRRLGELRQGRGELTNLPKEFQKIILNAENTEDAFVKFSTALRAANLDTADLGATLDKAFSEAGRQFVPFFTASNDSIRDAIESARELGVVISEDDARAAEKFRDQVGRLGSAFKGLGFTIAGQLTEPFTVFIESVAIPRIKEFKDFIEGIDAEKISAAFELIAEKIDQSVGGLVRAGKAAQTILDALTTSDEERAVQDQIDALQTSRSVGPFGAGTAQQIFGTLQNFANRENDARIAQERVAAQAERQTGLLEQISQSLGINGNDGARENAGATFANVNGGNFGTVGRYGQEFTTAIDSGRGR